MSFSLSEEELAQGMTLEEKKKRLGVLRERAGKSKSLWDKQKKAPTEQGTLSKLPQRSTAKPKRVKGITRLSATDRKFLRRVLDQLDNVARCLDALAPRVADVQERLSNPSKVLSQLVLRVQLLEEAQRNLCQQLGGVQLLPVLPVSPEPTPKPHPADSSTSLTEDEAEQLAERLRREGKIH